MTGEQLLEFVTSIIERDHPRLLCFHSADGRRDQGAGFPDLVIVGPGGVIYRECKGPAEELSARQVNWKYALIGAGASWGVWRPADLEAGRVERHLEMVS